MKRLAQHVGGERVHLDCFADNAEGFLAPQQVRTEARKSFVTFNPLGVVLAVMPWNFPFWQVVRFAAPALMAGNVGLLKHASNVSGCALALQEIFRRAGFPEGTFQTLLMSSRRVARVRRGPPWRTGNPLESSHGALSVARCQSRAP